MKIDTTLGCGHAFRLELPDSIFGRGDVIVPCSQCGARYKIDISGRITPYSPTARGFPTLHY